LPPPLTHHTTPRNRLTANYVGACPQNFTAKAGEDLFEPQKACDFSMTLEGGPDFVVTSPVPGACEQNLKMFVHSTCFKEETTYASGMMADVPALAPTRRSTRMRSRFHPPEEPSATAAAAAAGSHPGHRAPGMAAELESGVGSLPFGSRADSAYTPKVLLESSRQSSAADVQPLTASLLLAAAAALML
jgi:hypothetical protein